MSASGLQSSSLFFINAHISAQRWRFLSIELSIIDERLETKMRFDTAFLGGDEPFRFAAYCVCRE